MKILDLIKESPRPIDPTDFGMTQQNKHSNMITTSKTYGKFITDLNGCSLYDNGNSIVLLDDNTHRVIYFSKYELIPIQNKTFACQTAVWRDKNRHESKGVPEKIFWELYYNSFDGVITDSLQTKNAIDFWKRIINDSLIDKNNNVYLLFDMNKLIKIDSKEDFNRLESEYKIWSVGTGRFKRIIISKSELIINNEDHL